MHQIDISIHSASNLTFHVTVIEDQDLLQKRRGVDSLSAHLEITATVMLHSDDCF